MEDDGAESGGLPESARRAARPRRDVEDEDVDPGPPWFDSAAEEEAEEAAEPATPFDLTGTLGSDGGELGRLGGEGGAWERKRIARSGKFWEERGERREREQVHDGGEPP